MHFILLCMLIGAVILIPRVRALIGVGISLFMTGFLVLIGLGLAIWLLVSLFSH